MSTYLLITGVAVGVSVVLYYRLVKGAKCKSKAKLDGKTVIITGGNTGIGKATALELARRGARVILACRSEPRAKAAVNDIRRESGSSEVVYMQLDLASLESVRSFAETFLKTEPRLDLLINNAGERGRDLSHQQRRGDGARADGGGAGPGFRGEPPGPLPAHPPPAGASEDGGRGPRGERGGSALPAGGRELPRPDRPPAGLRPLAVRLGPRPIIQQQQAVQPALHPGAGESAGGNQCHLLQPAPWGGEDGDRPGHAAVAEAPLPPHGGALLPGRGGGVPDHAALRPSGGHRALQRPLLLRLRRAGSGRQSVQRRSGQEAVGSERDAVRPELRLRPHRAQAPPTSPCTPPPPPYSPSSHINSTLFPIHALPS